MNGVIVKVYLLRGYSGAGKSTYANKLKEKSPNLIICSSDSYFMKDGKYVFDVKKLGSNHLKCYNAFVEALCLRKDVCVDNTNVKLTDVKKYLDFVVRLNKETHDEYEINVVTVVSNTLEEAISYRVDQPDDKNVPADKIEEMRNTLLTVPDDLIRDEYPGININFLTVYKSSV